MRAANLTDVQSHLPIRPKIRHAVSALLFGWIACWSTSALAAWIESDLYYDGTSLGGHSFTSRDIEPDYDTLGCWPDGYGGQYCHVLAYQGVWTESYFFSPSSSSGPAYAYDFYHAQTDLPTVISPASGVWQVYGYHYVRWAEVVVQCIYYGGCVVVEHLWNWDVYQGASYDEVTVP